MNTCSIDPTKRITIGWFEKSADLFVHTFLKLHYWTLTLEVSQTSMLITGVSSLIPSSSRIPTLPGHVANLLAILALYSTLPIVVTFPLSLVVSILCYLVFFSAAAALIREDSQRPHYRSQTPEILREMIDALELVQQEVTYQYTVCTKKKFGVLQLLRHHDSQRSCNCEAEIECI
ncbi:hypothetical protein Tco_0818544 [Tanacetum coccineum]